MDSPSSMTNVHHISGLDDRERGFNRQVHVIGQETAYQARLRYEALQIEVESSLTEEEALQRVVQGLQERGYTQLRTQRIFHGEHYLGSQDLWVDYPDPEPEEVPALSWFQQIRKFLGLENQ